MVVGMLDLTPLFRVNVGMLELTPLFEIGVPLFAIRAHLNR